MTEATQTVDLVSRDALMQQLTEARFGVRFPVIDRTTFWRWCKRLGLSSSQSTYTSDESFVLHQYAENLRRIDIQKQSGNWRKQ
jgi:hypothetical protein